VVQFQAAQNDGVVYHLEFVTATRPSRVRIEENVLNEIEFAPGNAWETSYITRILQQDRPAQEGLLLSRKQPLVFDCDWNRPAATQGGTTALLDRWRMTRQFGRYGIGHILSGYDHLLFICALVLRAFTLWDLVKVVSAFTLAHTLTLTLSVLNIVRLPSHIVEPMIAGSIVFVAVANLLWPKRSRGHVRLATAFFFGLFHGLGFACGLLDAMNGMSGVAVGVAITAFSLGVEFGHQMVVLPVFFGVKLARRLRADAAGREWISLAVMRAGSLFICVGWHVLPARGTQVRPREPQISYLAPNLISRSRARCPPWRFHKFQILEAACAGRDAMNGSKLDNFGRERKNEIRSELTTRSRPRWTNWIIIPITAAASYRRRRHLLRWCLLSWSLSMAAASALVMPVQSRR